ncbi:7195_t:CDS:2, partial [Paraglomus brasilianum]
DPDLENKLPRFTHVWDNKVYTEWRSAVKVCYFCEKEGHIKRECEQYKVSVELRNAHREYKQKKAGLFAKKGNEKHEAPEQVPHHAPTPDTIMDNMEISTSIVDAQIHQPGEGPVEKENQTNSDSGLVTRMEVTEPTTRGPVTQKEHMTEAPDKGENVETQQDSPETPSLPEYMRGNVNLRDELDTLPPSSNTNAHSKEGLDPKLSETTMESTNPNDPEQPLTDDFITVVNKRSAASRKIKGPYLLRIMTQNFKLKIATLNVKGLNNKDKQRITLTLLKSYQMDIIFLQETNTTDKSTRDFLKAQWIYDSIWTSKTAILA